MIHGSTTYVTYDGQNRKNFLQSLLMGSKTKGVYAYKFFIDELQRNQLADWHFEERQDKRLYYSYPKNTQGRRPYFEITVDLPYTHLWVSVNLNLIDRNVINPEGEMFGTLFEEDGRTQIHDNQLMRYFCTVAEISYEEKMKVILDHIKVASDPNLMFVKNSDSATKLENDKLKSELADIKSSFEELKLMLTKKTKKIKS